ncbi:hypothetical protein C8R44DRAFT_863719 [Mycena epipterygia]|nr:hypothetical protein C8R44DRAFT_863719 [Mycena epipterygia]
MLRNSSDTFISQSTSRKFLDTVEDLLTSSRTSPVVRKRVMDVLAAAAYASGSKTDTGFCGLWRRVKPRDKPEEGVPFDTEDPMFNPPPADEGNELTRKIGFLTATTSEDWMLVLDVCEHASASKSSAKEAARALRREFKYGKPAAQLAAARLWAIMLHNSSDTFISQSTSRKFLNTLKNLLTSSRTIPVVRERVMDVLAAAAYASTSKKDAGLRGLWRRVRPRDEPEGAMFNPPLPSGRQSAHDYDTVVYHHAASIVPGYDTNSSNAPDVPYHDATSIIPDAPVSEQPSHSEYRHRIIPSDEDMRRLFQECKIGIGNATLLSQALAMATPEELSNTVIIEFHEKCIDSQELIFMQIPWASADAERSRAAKDQEERERNKEREHSTSTLNSLVPDTNGSVPDLLDTPLSTREEELLADLVAANEALLEVLKLFEDLRCVAIEREAEDRSRKEVRMDPRPRQYISEEDAPGGAGSSRSRSPSPARVSVQHPQVVGAAADLTFQALPALQAQQTLTPPPAAPHGPRLPVRS